MMRLAAFVLLAFLSLSFPAAAAQAAPSVDTAAATACAHLSDLDLARLQDAPTLIAEGAVVGAAAESHCQVRGLVAPGVTFQLDMPLTAWNGKILEVGCAGMCGSVLTAGACVAPLHRGYACIATDMGHRSTPDDALWTFGDPQAQADFAYRATHVVILAGRAVVLKFYGRTPAHSYFMGCSTGGYQGLVEAQRFPWDFDGIVAVAPDMNETDLAFLALWTAKVLTRPDGSPVLRDADLALLHAAALKACGAKETPGLMGDPRACRFDPRSLVCAATVNCLTAEQAEAARKVYAGPSDSAGAPLTYGGGFQPGSELNWNSANVSAKPSNWALDMFRYAFFSPPRGPAFGPADIDFESDYKRLGAAAQFTDDDPDLRRFKAAGGKLILAQGWADQYEPPLGAVNYYETTERTMGGRAATQSFLRLFMLPDMWHCTGGPGAFAVDYLGYLEDWVERGAAPDQIVAAHVPHLSWGQAFGLKFPLPPGVPVDFSRPIYPYPARSIYRGAGNAYAPETHRPR